jgi:uncharacterized protein YecE (DUF72 family)
MSKGRIRIGTSGFSYKDWLGNFYPQFCPQQDFLRMYAHRFDTVEIDATFYRIPTEKMVRRWDEQTSKGFLFTAKFPRTVTHEGDLQSRLEDAAHFIEVMSLLGPKLGPLLLQFPYSFKPDQSDLLAALLEGLPADRQIAVEVRHKGWLQHGEALDLFRRQNRALCLIDHPWMPRLDAATADFVYMRFLGDRKKIQRNFTYLRYDREDDLQWWAGVIRRLLDEGHDIFAYFNNHYTGHSPTTAARMIEILSTGGQ